MINTAITVPDLRTGEDSLDKIAVFYHIGQMGHWEEVYKEQMQLLVDSGLYDACDFVFCGINGIYGKKPLPHPGGPKVLFDYNENVELESDTLKRLWEFCRSNPDYRVLYIHTKGVTRDGWLGEVTTAWRHYLEYFNISKWQQCIEQLETHDTCGVQLTPEAGYDPLGEEYDAQPRYSTPYYDGNFWWANASYINKLDPQYLYTDDMPFLRGKGELWIGTAQPNAACLYKFDFEGNPYDNCDYRKELYMNERKAKIVMIAMFKNEASVLRRMLDSTLGHCDYYVMQNNGSTDGSDEIARNFLTENGLSGEVYDVEEGWVGFGWNRDHLIKYCQATDHGCDWILKMDCDEILEVDEDFDWSLLEDKSIASFHVPAVSGSCIYYRAWLWNASWKWAFHHDPCHETIYCTDPAVGEEFDRVNLPPSIRQIGFNEGQSWSVPTKFVSDALVLEEKMIREQTMLDNLYHFWYIGKSFADAYWCPTFPLGEEHRKEFARRCVFYFEQYVKQSHPNGPSRIDEMSYFACVCAADALRFLKEYERAIDMCQSAAPFAPERNDHLISMCFTYREQQDWQSMLTAAETMLNPERKCPFPQYISFIDRNQYVDTGPMPQQFYDEALGNIGNQTPLVPATSTTSRMFIVDNFYANPDAVREFALGVDYHEDLRWYKGLRSNQAYRNNKIKEAFEKVIGEPIQDWEQGFNGVFQLMKSNDPQVYHYDSQKWAAMIYLTPDAPTESGTRLHKSRTNGTRHRDEFDADVAFDGDFYDSTKFDIADAAGNVYNRLVIMDAGCFHSAGPYFGNTMETGRLTHLFFFD